MGADGRRWPVTTAVSTPAFSANRNAGRATFSVRPSPPIGVAVSNRPPPNRSVNHLRQDADVFRRPSRLVVAGWLLAAADDDLGRQGTDGIVGIGGDCCCCCCGCSIVAVAVVVAVWFDEGTNGIDRRRFHFHRHLRLLLLLLLRHCDSALA